MDQLKGYLAACSSFDVEWIEQEDDDTFVVTAVEQFRKEKSVGQFHSFSQNMFYPSLLFFRIYQKYFLVFLICQLLIELGWKLISKIGQN